MKDKIDIIIVDEHRLFVEGLTSLLTGKKDMQVIATASTGKELLELLSKLKPNVVLVDINLPDILGIELIKKVKGINKHIELLVLSMHQESNIIARAIKAGALGYLLKESTQNEVVDAIKAVYKGELFLGNGVKEAYFSSLTKKEEPRRSAPIPRLSKRELEILHLIVEEYTTKEISDKLFLSEHTVESHRSNIIQKLDVRNVAGLVKKAIEYELLSKKL